MVNDKQATPNLLFYAKDALISRKAEEKLKEEPNHDLINDIGTALRFIAEDFGSQIESLESLLKNGEITFDLLWAIFPPKVLVIAPTHSLANQPQALNLVSGTYGKRENGSSYFGIYGRIIHHDGEDFGYGFIDIEIDEFVGATKVASLKALPLHFHSDRESVRNDLIARGKKYLSLILGGHICQEYTYGFGLKEITENASGRVTAQKISVRHMPPLKEGLLTATSSEGAQ